MSPKGKDDIMLDLKILCIRKIFNMEELLNLFHTIFRQVDCLLFLVNNKISRLFDLFSHDRIHLGELSARLASLQLTCKYIACLIKCCRLSALT